MTNRERQAASTGETARPARATGRSTTRRPNRAEVKAMESRTAIGPTAERVAVTAVRVPTEATTASSPGRSSGGVATARTRTRTRTAATTRRVGITRAEEYRFIRSDLRRLLFTAGGLGLVMLALLLVLEV